ncbi:hypothetical protein [Nitriliruptor alkaliphilus]|uniref:hypothetical protein n=1 Tax=Nitriliruptor alkaliphilus TaxID=427918 RepID=UPI0006971189|nr:hypothetical protein [Nitriliruptor alkaliphilus]
MDPLLVKTLIDTLADGPPRRHGATPPRPRPGPARLRAAAAMRRWADRVEPRTVVPTVCSA